MHQRHFTFTQAVPATSWQVNNIPAGAEGAVITHIIATNGQILQPENQLIAPYGLELSFGVTAIAGKAYGQYYIEGGDTTTVETDGNVVHITVNQGVSPN